MGFGVDGAVSLSFSHLRSVAPWLFFSSVLNKLWYGLCGLYQIILGRHRRDLSRAIHITCDGRDVSVPVGIRGLVALNINSYAGGTSLWHADQVFQRGFGARLGSWGGSSMSDGVLEVMGVYGIRHLGLIKSGMASAVPICQGRHVVFNCTIQTPMQIDGEPFMQKPCVVDLALDSRINVTVPVISNVVSNTAATGP
jgi:diacylglycerol kinase (ATP)